MTSFSSHCHEVVKEYVHNVMIIDDGAQLDSPSISVEDLTVPLSSNPFISNDTQHSVTETTQSKSENIHPLDTLSLTNAFFEEGIVAGIYQPKISDGQSPSEFALVARSACEKADIIILDWILKDRNSDYSKAIVKEILRTDCKNGGRIRAVMIYTGESNLNFLRDELWDYLDDIALSKSIDLEIHSENLVIAFYNKDHQTYTFSPDRAVKESDIPKEALKSFSNLVNGLIPAFAIKSAASIRKNTGRIISRFGKNLDSGYLAHRVLLPKPEDSEVFMLENFVSYMRNILAISKVDNSTLGSSAIEKWIKQNYLDLEKKIEVDNHTCQVNLEELIKLSREGFSGKLSQIVGKSDKELSKQFTDISKKPALGAISIFNSNKIKVLESSVELSILSSFRRTFKDIVGINESPYLTQGSLIYSMQKDQFLLCITPKCDTVRINRELNFSFVILNEVTDGKFDIVIPENKIINENKDRIFYLQKNKILYQIIDNHLTGNGKENVRIRKQLNELKPYERKNYLFLHTSQKFHKLEHITFETDSRKRVLSHNADPSIIEYWDEHCNDYIWIGDLHDLNTISRVGSLVSNLNRTGTDEVEWLRRNSQ